MHDRKIRAYGTPRGEHLMAARRVTLFVQCVVDALYPEVAEAMAAVLEGRGLVLDYPAGQTCCGQPAFNAGFADQACKAAKHFIEVFEDAGTVVCPSGSCVAMVRHHYPLLLADEPDWCARARAVAAKTFEFCQFLVDELGVTELGAVFNGTVTYHDSCHLLRELGVADQPRQLIRGVKGLRFVEMNPPDRCCGFGGTFAVKYPQISTAMVDEKIDAIRASGADTVVGADMACLMNIAGRISRRKLNINVLHLAQLLAGRRYQ